MSTSSPDGRIRMIRTQAHFSDHINEQLQGDGVVNQGVGVEGSEVFPRTGLVVHCTQVRADFVAVFNSADGEWEGAPCERKNRSNLNTSGSVFKQNGVSLQKGKSSAALRSQSLTREPICTPEKPSSVTQRLISSTARSGACMGRVPRPTNLLGWRRTVRAKSLFKRTQRSRMLIAGPGLRSDASLRHNHPLVLMRGSLGARGPDQTPAAFSKRDAFR
ncbi:hypothetical protein EYF80_037989 [Liparis tanakae]|uniref:Uncharacterized protein n=1 Tax=Liparis tanakae TaxID=230148 RepID=A0A4Z2GF15_9TELE|nr:hypothetical protein EYF80_037989 [Liparis tanakae]